MARARSASTSTSLAAADRPASVPSMMAARMARADSERGLSSVMTRMSASRAATSPMIGRLSRSRSPPQPRTMITRPVTTSRVARDGPGRRRPGCGRSRRGPGTPGRRRPAPSGPGRRGSRRMASAATLRLDPVMDGGGQRGQRVGHVEASGQADSGSDVRAAGTHGRELRGPGGAQPDVARPSSRRAGPGHRSSAGSARPRPAGGPTRRRRTPGPRRPAAAVNSSALAAK